MDDQAMARGIIDEHRAAGTFFTAAGIRSFVRQQGDGPPIVLMHGLPASSFLYRKVIPELADRGYHALSFDWPGLGLADRPRDYDYSIGGIGAFAAEAVDVLVPGEFHLVVHDAGGPVGFELAMRRPERVRSLTILNTMIELPSLPFPGELLGRLSHGGIGRLMSSPRVWRQILYRVGVQDRSALTMPEVLAWRDLALGDNEAATYLEIMRCVRQDHDPRRWRDVVDTRKAPYPVQVVWGGLDPMLSLRRFGWRMLEATGLPSLTALPAKHFLQEDHAPQVAALIAEHATQAHGA